MIRFLVQTGIGTHRFFPLASDELSGMFSFCGAFGGLGCERVRSIAYTNRSGIVLVQQVGVDGVRCIGAPSKGVMRLFNEMDI